MSPRPVTQWVLPIEEPTLRQGEVQNKTDT